MSEDPSSLIQENQTNGSPFGRRERPARACRLKSAARLHAAAVAEAEEAASVRRRKSGHRKERVVREEEPEREPTPPPEPQCKIITQLVGDPPPSQGPRWELRSMWELASVLNFLNVFRQFLNVKVEFSVEELETALITPNQTLADLHIPLLKAIPPIARMALGRNTWITVLCRKLKHWWYWVAEGDLPIIASHGTEFEAYNALDPRVRVIILKAICDIRVEQEDIRNYIDDSIKGGIRLSTFRKERIGGDSYGISYWYEDDPIIGHRLYREIRKMDVKKAKGKNAQPLPSSCYQWETVATNLDDFVDVAEKLLASKNRTEASVGKKLKNDMLPEIEAVHKKREKLLKKQQREALYLDNVVHMDGFGPGRSLRGRKPVTYTFDDFDRSINEAIKINKNTPPSPNSIIGGEKAAETDTGTEAYMMNGHVNEKSMVDARNVYHSLKGGVFKPNLQTFNILLSGWKSSDEAEAFFGEMKEMGVKPDLVSYNCLIDVYCKSREIEKAYKVFDRMREEEISPDVISYTSLIGGLGLVGQPDKARELLEEMKEYGCYPDTAAYNAVIRNFCIAKRIGDAYALLDEMVMKGLEPNPTTYNVFLRSFFWANDLVSSWNMYCRMRATGVLPNTQSCMFLIRLLQRHEKVDMAIELWDDMMMKGFGSYTLVSDVLFDLLCDMGKIEEAEKCFLEMVEKGQKPSNVSFRRIKVLMELANKHDGIRILSEKMATFGSFVGVRKEEEEDPMERRCSNTN